MSIAYNDKIDLAKLGKAIRDARERDGLTREKAAELLGISLEYLKSLENCKGKTPSLKVFVRLVRLYNLSADYLIHGEPFISYLINTSKDDETGRNIVIVSEEDNEYISTSISALNKIKNRD